MAALMLSASAVLLLVGMVAGIVMGVQHDFTLGPAHAHLNLVGGVLTFLCGLYYRAVPQATTLTLARAQAALHIVGSLVFPFGIALVATQGIQIVAIVGSLIVTLAMALFVVVVLRTARA
ncbi:hypothetical protein JQ557_20210 [Bradyrhizobium sp. U87765 SZCCT0131]|uniref:hypothetical protein n=1 Tax=unclassified Bradyrhizobium TaxID=2631580 RepID=UPI001BABCDEC|nr:MULTISPECIES: hypothetical protein [unclassified Bradyrhizobium]MBR1220336.1 hypothetical protein [Bradyrhizobium sp. U87765 SZCCT0131]MBR1263209.1 hypothetical protein [Bradyrhizobium sp. U87765 SZCCT0134]MBR1306908.1 hypothetical protein [Bradyrhizobium sp. U87765 SZCCT0110]MBR1323407.1 hypothetical protein [Bradyrhizobium sp. U87765 SZCCT0109]MBR1345862.1 hypothetical protein [Bradyrhizobium sp. U87765 SZCCT0048]